VALDGRRRPEEGEGVCFALALALAGLAPVLRGDERPSEGKRRLFFAPERERERAARGRREEVRAESLPAGVSPTAIAGFLVVVVAVVSIKAATGGQAKKSRPATTRRSRPQPAMADVFVRLFCRGPAADFGVGRGGKASLLSLFAVGLFVRCSTTIPPSLPYLVHAHAVSCTRTNEAAAGMAGNHVK